MTAQTILPANTLSSGGYDVANSCRFGNPVDGTSASDYLTITPGSASNRRTFTISFWAKRGTLNPSNTFQQVIGQQASNYFRVGFGSNEQGNIFRAYGRGGFEFRTKVFIRDVTAWYHFVLTIDTTQGTAGNRAKLYINGVRQTEFFTENYPDQNTELDYNLASAHVIGRSGTSGNDAFNGYLAEFVSIDGTAYQADSFGEFDTDSPTVWKPIDVSGLTFGTNGFYLDFEDSGDLGDDESGNGNDFTETGIDATNQGTDTCTNNFATLNSLINFNSGVFTEGNLAITFGDDTVSTIGLTSGRWYWEAQRTNTSNEAHFGIGVSRSFGSATSIVSSGDRIYTRGGATFFSAVSNLSILTFGSNGGTSATVSNGDVIGFYLDLDSGTKNLTIKKNDGGTPIVDVDLTYTGEEPIFPFCRMNSGCASSWNFGNPIAALSSANADANGHGSFEYNPTKGGVDYFAICTKNLAEHG